MIDVYLYLSLLGDLSSSSHGYICGYVKKGRMDGFSVDRLKLLLAIDKPKMAIKSAGNLLNSGSADKLKLS
jgi:hypothetical protein